MKELLCIRYKNASNRAIAAYPVTYGVPFPEGALNEPGEMAVRLPGSELQPVQSRVLERYADGSIRWLLLDFELPVSANEEGEAALVQNSKPFAVALKRVETQETAGEIRVTTAQFSAVIRKDRFSLLGTWEAGGQTLAGPAVGDIMIEDLAGKVFRASLDRSPWIGIVENGPQRVRVEARGRHTAEDGETLFDFRVRWTFRPSAPCVLIAYKFTNREEPERGIKVKSIRMSLPTALGPETTKLVRQVNHGTNWFSRRVEISEDVELFAGGAVNQAARDRYGEAAAGKVLIRNFESLKENLNEYPHFLRPGNARTDMSGGLRQMYPYLAMHDGRNSALAWFYEMENNNPKSLIAEGNRLIFDIWPAWAGEFLLRRGQSKEHDLYVSLCERVRAHEEAEGIYFDHEIGKVTPPVELTLDPDYVRSCKVLDLHRWLRYDEERYLRVEIQMGSACRTISGFAKGMMDVGDGVSHDRSWCHNNENDWILGAAQEYFRQAAPSMLAGVHHNARHNAHVDFIAYDPDPLRQGTMPAHCPEHTDGSTYPSHMWAEGLLAAYCMTGEPDYRDAALSVGENMLRWQKLKPEIFYADSRECGWPMVAFLRLHEFTREQRWLDACEEIFQFYRSRTTPDGKIKYALPHGVGIVLEEYGAFMAWRGLFFYWERTGKTEVREFLIRVLEKVYKRSPRDVIAYSGWGSNDLFPAWAAYQLTGDDKYIEDNYPFMCFLMNRREGFGWGGIDMHPYLCELDRRGTLERFCRMEKG